MALNLTTIDATNLFENNTPKTGLTFYTSNNEIIDYNDTSKYHIDHIIPISKWLTKLNGIDPNDISNLQLVEKKENLIKGNEG